MKEINAERGSYINCFLNLKFKKNTKQSKSANTVTYISRFLNKHKFYNSERLQIDI